MTEKEIKQPQLTTGGENTNPSNVTMGKEINLSKLKEDLEKRRMMPPPKTFNLSEKKFNQGLGWRYEESDIKEFIKIVELIVLQKTITDEEKVIIIRERAGKDLI